MEIPQSYRFLGTVIWLSFLALHIYTVTIAFGTYGWGGAIVTTILPFIAEVLWIIKQALALGILNTYTFLVAGFAVEWWILAMFMHRIERKLIFGAKDRE